MTKTISVLLTALLLAPLAAPHAGDGPRQKPNVVFILADDQRFDELGCTGHPLIKTPNIDRLAREGALFGNSFVSSASCLPNRASLLMGQWERRHTVGWNSGSALSPGQWADTLPMVLKRNGYATAYLGKNHTPGLRHWDFDYYYGNRLGHLGFHPKATEYASTPPIARRSADRHAPCSTPAATASAPAASPTKRRAGADGGSGRG